MRKPGTNALNDETSATPASFRRSPVTATMDMGTLTEDSVRFCAVTTISARPGDSADAAASDAAGLEVV